MSKDLTVFGNPSGLAQALNAEAHELEERIVENVSILLLRSTQ